MLKKIETWGDVIYVWFLDTKDPLMVDMVKIFIIEIMVFNMANVKREQLKI